MEARALSVYSYTYVKTLWYKMLLQTTAGDSLPLPRPSAGNEFIHKLTGGLHAQGTEDNL